jgi:hypothetical protein
MVNNNGGTIKSNGTTSNVLFKKLKTNRPNSPVFGSSVIEGVSSSKALSSGVFKYNNNRPVAKKTTDLINGSPNMYLISGASEPNLIRSTNSMLVKNGSYKSGARTRKLTTAIRTGNWSIYSNKFAEGFPQVSVDDFGGDYAVMQSRNDRGSLFFIVGKSVTKNTYSAKS